MTEKNISKTPNMSKRNIALDLLRIIAMLMIVFLHSNSHGGLFDAPKGGFDGYTVLSYVTEVLCIGSVNIFVLISGYFLCEQTFRVSRVVKLILQTVFYSWLIGTIMIATGKFPLASIDTIYSFLPISYRNYWFISAYIGLYLLSPVMNKCISALSKRQHRATVLLLVVMTALWSDIVLLSDPFVISRGYSLSWFAVLYFTAAYIRKHVDLSKVFCPGGVYLATSTVLLAFMLIVKLFAQRIPLLENYDLYSYYTRYNSFIVYISSLALFCAFLKLRLHSRWLTKIVQTISPLTLGVYLIHDNPYIRTICWGEWFPLSSFERNLFLPIKTLGAVLLIFVCCIVIEFGRAKLFGFFESCVWYQKVLNAVDNLVVFIDSKLFKMEECE